MKPHFNLTAPFEPTGDQPEAIDALCRGISENDRFQILEGVTGSGKTFTMANVIARTSMPAIIISHNKTLAAQLYSEMKSFFPDNAVEYFISYYDYYQPEAYIPQTDTHIDKDASINEEIEKMRLSATNSLIARDDVIVIASVSCIYGLGSPEDYKAMMVQVAVGQELDRDELLRSLVDIHYERNEYETLPGSFRVRGDTVDIFPSYSDDGIRISLFGTEVDGISVFDPLTGKTGGSRESVLISAARHFVMPDEKVKEAFGAITAEMTEQIKAFEASGKLLEAQRIRMRTMYDLEMMREMGYCPGIENYSRHLSGRAAGDPPCTLLEYFPDKFLTIVDESHATIPQLKAMFRGDQARKQTLVEHGFRLPSALDNRPLSFDEFMKTIEQTVFCTATPGPFEVEVSSPAVLQSIRPTGIIDPPVTIRPLDTQIDDLMEEVRAHAERNERVLVTTLTKRTAEDLAEYLASSGLRVQYLHSNIEALERVEILRALRSSDFDCLVGINLLREGLDLPEVALVAILDADKEGFLRSETSLLQTAGRAARNVTGKVILYADDVTKSMQRMLDVTESRRKVQVRYNEAHGITPRTIVKPIGDSLSPATDPEEINRGMVREDGVDYDVREVLNELKQEMVAAAERLEFERAAMLRDQIRELERDDER